MTEQQFDAVCNAAQDVEAAYNFLQQAFLATNKDGRKYCPNDGCFKDMENLEGDNCICYRLQSIVRDLEKTKKHYLEENKEC